MVWHARYSAHPQYGQFVRTVTGRPPWVLRATAVVAVAVFSIPLVALAVLMLAALLLTAAAWVVFSAIGRAVDLLTGQGSPGSPQDPPPVSPNPDPKNGTKSGRENVRIIRR